MKNTIVTTILLTEYILITAVGLYLVVICGNAVTEFPLVSWPRLGLAVGTIFGLCMIAVPIVMAVYAFGEDRK